jgi:hypothetical protein
MTKGRISETETLSDLYLAGLTHGMAIGVKQNRIGRDYQS